jgi:ubiquinone/menaquinone biosynthesis C-methylase UbiE
MSQDQYIIEGGAGGKKRLAVLGDILNEGTRALIGSIHPASIESFLDLGCGGGSVSLMMASAIGPTGHVTGMDFDESILALARADAAAAGLTNISFEAVDAMALDARERFDFSYSRFLLSHVTDPQRVLQNLLQATRPGGTILVEDIDFSGHYCYPENESFERYQHFFVTAAQHNGQNSNIGLALFNHFRNAGIENVQFDLVQPVFQSGTGKWMAVFTLEKIRSAVIRQGLATESEVNAVLEDLKAFTADERSIISLPRIFRVWGKRKL